MSPFRHLTFGSGSCILGKLVNSGLVFQQYDSFTKCSVHFFVLMYVWALDKRQSPIASTPQLNTMCKKMLQLHKFCSTGQQNRKQHLREWHFQHIIVTRKLQTHDFRLPPWCKWDLLSFALLQSLITNVLWHPICLILEGGTNRLPETLVTNYHQCCINQKNTDLKTLDIVAKSSQALSLLNEPKKPKYFRLIQLIIQELTTLGHCKSFKCIIQIANSHSHTSCINDS